MLTFTERARIALERSPRRLRTQLTSVISEIESGEALSSQNAKRSNSKEWLWVYRVDARTRLLFSRKGDDVVIEDILDKSAY
jgi:hypothetical protein